MGFFSIYYSLNLEEDEVSGFPKCQERSGAKRGHSSPSFISTDSVAAVLLFTLSQRPVGVDLAIQAAFVGSVL